MRAKLILFLVTVGIILNLSFISKTKTMPIPVDKEIKNIVIDAGHGGNDPGCQYGGKKEKDITLDIALQVGDYLKQYLKNVNVIYTRTTDTFIALHERASIANNNKADIFVSIHVNAAKNTQVEGTETYVIGLHKNQENLEVSIRENEVIKLEDNYKSEYQGFNPNSPEAYIVFSLFQDNNRKHSINLATKIENDFKNKVNRKSRGVKEAGFVVLWRTTMPSVLVETGYLSNSNDRSFLSSSEGKKLMASAIYRSIKSLKIELESK